MSTAKPHDPMAIPPNGLADDSMEKRADELRLLGAIGDDQARMRGMIEALHHRIICLEERVDAIEREDARR